MGKQGNFWPRRSIAFWTCAAVCLGFLVGVTVAADSTPADAYTGSDFNAGYIISDANFYNSSAMSIAEIQAFLSSKGSYLANYSQATTTKAASSSWTCATYQGASNESAATIIYKAQQACGISAMVLLTTLQKEQGLITSGTSDGLYKAMGFACPDSGSCDANYYGFFNQVYSAARQFAWYGRGSFTYIQLNAWDSIRYSPNSSCGSKSVYVQNAATAALYYYTPYTPNDAALANLGRTGDGCSAYGNRNFWDYYYSWFGNPIGDLGLPISGFVTITENGGGVGRAYQYGSTYQQTGGVEYAVKGAVREVYFRMNGASGALGWPISNQVYYMSGGGGIAQAFQYGSIYQKLGSSAFVTYGAIRDAYFAQSGVAGGIGWPISDPVAYTDNGGGLAQAFQYASIYQPTGGGAYVITGSLRDKYFANQGAAGLLGWPISNILSITSNGTGTAQAFQNGSIYQASGGVPYAVVGNIRDAYFAVAGADGSLGWPISDVYSYTDNGGGKAQAFQGGSIYQATGGSAYVVAGSIREKYFQYQGSSGNLGWPTSAATSLSGGSDTQQTFQNGTIYQSGAGGVRVVTAAISATYLSNGGPTGSLGWPITDVFAYSANGGGNAQVFENGSIYQASGGGAYVVSGALREQYFLLGGSSGDLGWPTAGMQCSGSTCSQQFQYGSMTISSSGAATIAGPAGDIANAANAAGSTAVGVPLSGVLMLNANGISGYAKAYSVGSVYSSNLGAFVVSGKIRDRYFQADGAGGSLGWPVSAQSCVFSGNGCMQQFQNGRLYYAPGDTSARLSTADLFNAYMALGGATGTLGASLTDSIAIDSSGVGQAFAHGSLYSKQGVGTFAVAGPIRDKYFALGGATGQLGWPTAAATCVSTTSCAQTFQNATILWTAVAGATIQ